MSNEWLLWYFGSKDMGVAHTLSRTFFWSENILWKNDLLGHHASVFLGGKDAIINARQVYEYLQGARGGKVGNNQNVSMHDSETTLDCPSEGNLSKDDMLNVVWSPNLDHGQIFDVSTSRKRLVREVLGRARIDSPCN